MSNRTDVVVKLVLVFFVSLLSFSIGTYVGRKYSDNQHKMAQLEPGSIHESKEPAREVASEVAEAPAKNKESLTDEEIAKLAEEFVADDTAEKTDKHEAETGHGADPHAATAAHTTPAHEADPHGGAAPTHTAATSHEASTHAESTNHSEAPSKIAQQVAAGHGPVVEKSAPMKTKAATSDNPRIPSSIPKDVAQYSVGKFTVQVASFGTQVEADQRTHELQDKGYKAFIIPAQIKGKSWYRVSVGLFATEKEAKDYKTDFMAKSKVDSAIVQKISK